MGNKHLQRAFQVMMYNPDHCYQLGNFELVETHFSAVMFFEHVPSATLNLLNTLQCVLQFTVVYIVVSDFSKYNNLHILLTYDFSTVVPRLAAAKSCQESTRQAQWSFGKRMLN